MAKARTAKQRAALRKAQLASARKRRRNRLNAPHSNKNLAWRGKRMTNRQVRRVRVVSVATLGGAAMLAVYGARKANSVNQKYGI